MEVPNALFPDGSPWPWPPCSLRHPASPTRRKTRTGPLSQARLRQLRAPQRQHRRLIRLRLRAVQPQLLRPLTPAEVHRRTSLADRLAGTSLADPLMRPTLAVPLAPTTLAARLLRPSLADRLA